MVSRIIQIEIRESILEVEEEINGEIIIILTTTTTTTIWIIVTINQIWITIWAKNKWILQKEWKKKYKVNAI